MSCCAFEADAMTPSHDGDALVPATDFDGTIAPIVERPQEGGPD